jgi:hypothetical protein
MRKRKIIIKLAKRIPESRDDPPINSIKICRLNVTRRKLNAHFDELNFIKF